MASARAASVDAIVPAHADRAARIAWAARITCVPRVVVTVPEVAREVGVKRTPAAVRRGAALAAAAALVVGWAIPRVTADRARARGPAVSPDVDAATAARLIAEADRATAVAQEHPVSRALWPAHRVSAVWRDPSHCAPDEPGGSDEDRDYGATVRLVGWFGVPGQTITVRCGGASWHVGARRSQRAERASAGPARPGLVVEGRRFLVRIVGDELYADIPFSYHNARREPLLVPGCERPEPPTVQGWTGSEWLSAYVAVSSACFGVPLVIGPGATHRDTLRLRIASSATDANGRRVEPHWRVPESVTAFRLLWGVYERGDTLTRRAGPLVPEAERTSAPFALTIDGRTRPTPAPRVRTPGPGRAGSRTGNDPPT